MDKIFNKPFAINGARVAIPENGTENERVSFDKGFTQPYEIEAPSVDNPNGQGFNILRPEMNEALYQLSSACNLLAENIDKWVSLTTENLNNITQRGRYFQAVQSQATSANSYPVDEVGYLIVFDSINNNVTQFYKSANSNKIYVRYYDNSVWSAWDSVGLNSEFYTKTQTDGKIIGISQTWQNVKSQRASGVAYRNTTGKPIMVHISAAVSTNATSGGSIKFWVAGLLIHQFDYVQGSGAARPISVTAIIPNNSSYEFYCPNTTTITTWAELR